MTTHPPQLLTTRQAAERLGISQRQVQKLCKRGTIDADIVLDQYMISPAALFAARNRPAPGRPKKHPGRRKEN